MDVNDCNCTKAGPDGYLDLTLKFKTQRIVEAIGEVNNGDVLTLQLTGVLFGERPIEGTDCILIRGKHKPLNQADINKDGVVNNGCNTALQRISHPALRPRLWCGDFKKRTGFLLSQE